MPQKEMSGQTKAFPKKISRAWTVGQLREEAAFRGLDLGAVPLPKPLLLGILGEGSMSLIAQDKTLKQEPSVPPKKTNKLLESKVKSSNDKSKPKQAKNAQPQKKAQTAGSKASKGATSLSSDQKSDTKMARRPTAPSESSSAGLKKTKKTLNKDMEKKASLTKDTKTATSKNLGTIKALKPCLETKTAKPNKSVAASAPKPDHIPSAAAKSMKKRGSKPSSETTVATKKVKVEANAANVIPNTNEAATSTPRISEKLTLAQLRDEAKARQLDPKTLPKLKADLLHHLVDGSIHVEKSTEYRSYQALLRKLEAEKDNLYQVSLLKRQTKLDQQQRRAEEREAKARADREAERNAERKFQAGHHTLSHPFVHDHLLANTSMLVSNMRERKATARCNHCYYKRPYLTCETCDYDICVDCFIKENVSDEEKAARARRARIQYEKERKEDEERERREEEEHEIRWNATKQFTPAIMEPNDANKSLETKAHKFVVWCSDGYDCDGWHSYQGPPSKEFDTSWKSAQEANDRARYLFFWKNPWGMNPDEVGDDFSGAPEPTYHEGLVSYTAAPADSSRWSTAVVPKSAFRYLENATTSRHNYDDDESGSFDIYGGYGLGF